jgi:hypothetical protein
VDVDAGSMWGPGKTFCALVWMADNRSGDRGDGRSANWLLFVEAHSNGHGWWRSVWGSNIQETEEVDQDEEK